MTVSATTETRKQYTGNSGYTTSTDFTAAFKYLSTSEIKVTHTNTTTGTDTAYTEGTHYSVQSGASANSVTIRFLTSYVPTATTEYVTIFRETTFDQLTDYTEGSTLDAETLEQNFDKGIMLIQQVNNNLTDLNISFSGTNDFNTTAASASEISTSKANRTNKVLAFDSNGDITATQEIGTNRGDWATSATYQLRDLVKQASANDNSTKDNIYICIAAHTSTGTHLTQNDTAKWALILDVATASGGVAESADWARKVDGIVTASTGSDDYSSRAYAIGGTGVTNTAGKGSAKDWATKAEDSTVDTSEYSAKHYSAKASASASSASTSATTATNYATKVDGAVTGSNYSAQAWAVGGTGVTDTASRGSAKEWATAPEDDLVDTSEYSAKHYSIKASASATSASGSATSASNTAVRFLANKSSDPATRDPDGSGATLVAGDIYFNTSNNDLHIYTGSSWEQLDTTLPSQSGQSGKFLTTNGSALSWGETDSSDQIELTNAVTLSAETITYQKMYLGNTFTVAGNLIVNGNLVLGKIIADSTAQTLSGAGGYSITGTGTLTIGATLT